MKGNHYIYYDRAGRKQVNKVPAGLNPYRNAHPIDAYQIIGYMSESDAEDMPDYNEDYDMSDVMDINGYSIN